MRQEYFSIFRNFVHCFPRDREEREMVAMRFRPGGCFRFVVGRGVLLCCTVCVFWALLVVPAAHGQVIEEGGFPVKGGSISGESFSLSCPSRVFAKAGESVLLSCSATAVPEEGVRYAWESLSGDGLRLLSNANERSPLFTAPLSGESAEYVYRLTAMSVGVYETATVTVVVGGVSGGSVQDRGKPPVALEGCDSFGALEGFQEGCVAGDKTPPFFEPFEGDPEGEGGPGFLFPEAPGLPDQPSGPVRGGGFDRQTPPRLECPVAVFLEELETGSIECHAWDASGEEYLEYSWEPVGSTTRDYLDNPRLLPENAPNPSVVAPETSVYETLESFHSGETTFRYRYRLTAISRATGLSSSSEVEVFVSSSRPSVYCPLEVVVEEGETVTLDCEGVDPLSFRMDYDEESASVLWEWEGLWGTSTAPLDATHLSSPLFTAPAGSAGEEYHYIASMTTSASGVPRTARRRVTVTVSEAGTGAPISSDDIRLDNGQQSLPPSLDCEKYTVYEGAPDIMLDCEVTGGSSGTQWTWTWEGIGNTPNTNQLIAGTDSGTPTFRPPPNVTGDKKYSYKVTVEGFDAGVNVVLIKAATLVTVKERPDISVTCEETTYDVDEGTDDIEFDCEADGAPEDDSQYTWSWLPTTNLTSGTDTTATPTFDVPPDVLADATWTYTATVSADNAEDGSANVKVTVRNMYTTAIHCPGNPYSVDEGSDRYELDCRVENPPTNVSRDYQFTSRSGALALLDFTTDASPILHFTAPASVDADTTYGYTLRIAVGVGELHRVIASRDFSVTVRDTDSSDPSLTCTDSEVYEGATGITLDCSVTNEPSGATYAWAARGSTSDTDDLGSTTILKPTFDVPADIDESNGADKDYEYTVTMSASGIDDVTEDVTVTVLEKPDIYCLPFIGTLDKVATEFWEGTPDRTLPACGDLGGVGNKWGGAPGANPVYSYAWTPRGSTPDTRLLSATNIEIPRFYVPDAVDEDETHEYTMTVSAENADDASVWWVVQVLNKPDITVTCTDPDPVEEGDDDFELECEADGAPEGNSDYTWSWSPTADLTDYDTNSPTFAVPDDVVRDTTYTYTVTATADNAEDGTAEVTVTVKDKGEPAPVVSCSSNLRDRHVDGVLTFYVYERAPDIELECEVTNAATDAVYIWAWAGRGSTSDTSLLSADDVSDPDFDVPDVNGDQRYDYTVTATSPTDQKGKYEVTFNVEEQPDISITCDDPNDVIKGDPNFAFACTASGGTNFPKSWSWSPTTRLMDHDTGTPTFDVPTDVDQDTTYTYTARVSARWSDPGTATVSFTVKDADSTDPSITCNDSEVYEGVADFTLDCSVKNEPSGAAYAWAARGSTSGTSLLNSTAILKPTFDVPDNLLLDTDYDYTVTMSATGINNVTEDVTVTVLEKPNISCIGVLPGDDYYGVDEGGSDLNIAPCIGTWTGAPTGSDYVFAWITHSSTPKSALSLLSSTDEATVTFYTPSDVPRDTTYKYVVTVSADNADPLSVEVTVTVRNTIPVLACNDSEVYEATADITLDCSVTNEPTGATYAWEAHGSTSGTDDLGSTTILKPTFSVPGDIDEPGGADKAYEYTVTLFAGGADVASADVTVTILEKPDIVPCADFIDGRHVTETVYEGAVDFQFPFCHWTGAPDPNAVYSFGWTTRGSTPSSALSLLSDLDTYRPFFLVPDEVSQDETYRYTLTVSADNADPLSMPYTMTVLNKPPLALVCTPPAPVYEGAEDFDLDCVASGDPSGSDNYNYVWTGRGSTANTDNLSDPTIAKPTFDVPPEVDSDKTYEYTLTASAENAEDATQDVTVTVLKKKVLDVACATPSPVYEGSEDFALDCVATGAPAGSVIEYIWTGRGSTSNTDLLVNGTDGPTPTFAVPEEVDDDETYEYLLAVSAENAESATAEVTVKVLKLGSIALICASTPLVYEGSEDFALDCSISGDTGDTDYTYEWTARGATQNTAQLSATDIPSPTFGVPDALNETTAYEYLLTARAANVEDATREVTVTVLNRGTLAVACAPPPLVYEGAGDFALDCEASGAPAGSEYAYVWTARGSTVNTDLLIAGTDSPTPTFSAPDALDATTTYEYLLTVSAENAESGSARVAVTVLNAGALSVVCTNPAPVYEGSPDFALDCSASGAPAGSDYDYYWTPRGNTPNIDLLSDTTVLPPTFDVPEEVEETTTYEYLLTVSAENAESGSAEVTVTVLNKGALAVVCADPVSVYEGSADIALDCSASGAPAGSDYTYAWTARGNTLDASLLSATDVASPTFYVPDQVDGDETHEYRLTVSTSAENIDPGTFDLTVNVYDSPDLEVVCTDRTVYEGAPPFRLECTASGGPPGVLREWDWSPDTHLTGPRIRTPVFTVPTNVESDMTFTYTATVTAGSMVATGEVTVTVLNRSALAVVCADPGSVYEGSEDITFDCSASGVPGDNPQYTYAWTARGGTANTDLLIAGTDGPSPTFAAPDEVEEDETYEYTLTVSAENAEDASAEVTVTVLDRVQTPPSEPVSPPVEEPPPLASSSSTRESSAPTALGGNDKRLALAFRGAVGTDTGVAGSDDRWHIDVRIGSVPCGPHDAFAGRQRREP